MIYVILYLLFCAALVVGVVSVIKSQGESITIGEFLTVVGGCLIPLLNLTVVYVLLDELGSFNFLNKKLF